MRSISEHNHGADRVKLARDLGTIALVLCPVSYLATIVIRFAPLPGYLGAAMVAAFVVARGAVPARLPAAPLGTADGRGAAGGGSDHGSAGALRRRPRRLGGGAGGPGGGGAARTGVALLPVGGLRSGGEGVRAEPGATAHSPTCGDAVHADLPRLPPPRQPDRNGDGRGVVPRRDACPPSGGLGLGAGAADARSDAAGAAGLVRALRRGGQPQPRAVGVPALGGDRGRASPCCWRDGRAGAEPRGRPGQHLSHRHRTHPGARVATAAEPAAEPALAGRAGHVADVADDAGDAASRPPATAPPVAAAARGDSAVGVPSEPGRVVVAVGAGLAAGGGWPRRGDG